MWKCTTYIAGYIGRFFKIFNGQKDKKLAQPNFQYEKRQKELAKKKKQEEKKQRKLDEKNHPGDVPPEQSDEEITSL